MSILNLQVNAILHGHPLRRLMKQSGAEIVANEAVEEVIYWLQERAEKVTKDALQLAKNAHRKKVIKGDIRLAIKYFD